MRLRGRVLAAFCVLAFVCVVRGDGDQPAECTNLEQCNNIWRHGEAFECVGGRCKCHPQATLDETSGSCVCHAGYTKSGNKCIAPAVGNGTLGRNLPSGGPIARTQCQVSGDCKTNAECTNGECVCYSNYTMIQTTGNCTLAATQVGNYCEYHEVCHHNLGGRSECVNTRCVCDAESAAARNSTVCLQKKEIGGSCTEHEQCRHIIHTSCTDICSCDPGFVTFDGAKTCSPVVNKYNAICNDTAQCTNGKLGFGSLCKNDGSPDNVKRCVCESEFFYKQDLEMCMYAKGLGEKCDKTSLGCYLREDGEDQNIECNKNSVCQCKKGYHASEDKNQCEKDAGVMNNASYLLMIIALACVTKW